jgi:hypothetical protein
MYRIVITDPARRFVEDADAPLQRRLRRCFELLKSEPRKHRLSGSALKIQISSGTATSRERKGDILLFPSPISSSDGEK